MRVKLLWRQLGLIEFARVLAANAARRLIDPLATATYAQCSEDALIWRLLDYKNSGFYVDIGCNDPIRMSNTYNLYLRGWSGVAIDANDEFREAFRKHRPRDQFVHACVTEKSGPISFHVYSDRALSSVTREQVFESETQYRLEKTIEMEGRTGQEILAETRAPTDFDLLSIDAENHDVEVLRSIDFNVYRPRLIILEANHLDIENVAVSAAARHLKPYGYRVVACFANNLFFTCCARD